MTASDTDLSARMYHLDVESSNTLVSPGSATPLVEAAVSDETISLLTEVKKKLTAKSTKREADPEAGPSKATKRKRTDSGDDPNKKYPTEAKPLYLKAKNLYIKKLHLATSVHHIKEELNEGCFPTNMGYKCPPPNSDSTEFKLNWTRITNQHKRQLTLLWIEELSRKYVICKSDIKKILSNLKIVLSEEQYLEMHTMLEDRYKIAASKKMGKKLQKPEDKKKPQRKGKPTSKGPRATKDRKAEISNPQIRKLLMGLSKLVSK